MAYDYPPPLDKLLALPEPELFRGTWPDYPSELGLGAEHVPGLVRMATDPELARAPSDSREVYGPVHAWRALGQLRAREAIRPLIALVREREGEDWITAELPRVFALIGPDALPDLRDLLRDRGATEDARSTAASALAAIATAQPAVRGEVVTQLTQRLDAYPPESEFLNGLFVNYLLDLDAVEAAPVLERAYARGIVDLMAAGDWEDVQIELGLLSERLTPPPPDPFRELVEEATVRAARRAAREDEEEADDDFFQPSGSSPRVPSARARAREKARKKMAKKSRKQNRRK